MPHHTHGFSVAIAIDDESQPAGVRISSTPPGAKIVLDFDQCVDLAGSLLMAAQTVRSMTEIGVNR